MCRVCIKSLQRRCRGQKQETTSTYLSILSNLTSTKSELIELNRLITYIILPGKVKSRTLDQNSVMISSGSKVDLFGRYRA